MGDVNEKVLESVSCYNCAAHVYHKCASPCTGIPTVAIYSSADKGSRHVEMANQAFNIGSASASDSYLRHDRIIDVAQKCGASAIHPGYGFLSEDAEFAEICSKHNIAFVGPPPDAIRSMGDKSQAKALMRAAGVPVVPGKPQNN